MTFLRHSPHPLFATGRRAKLADAGERIVATDARYTRIELRRGPYGHELVVVRRRGGPALEEARAIRAKTRDAGLTPA